MYRYGSAKVASFWKWTRHRLMYCVRLWRWTRHPAPVKYQCAAMTQQPAGTYTLRRADCSTHLFKMGRPGASYLLQSVYETRPMRLLSPFVCDFPLKTKFLPIPPISFNIRPWSPILFPPFRLLEILIRYQRNRHVGLAARLPALSPDLARDLSLASKRYPVLYG